MVTEEFIPALINLRYPIVLPEHRVLFHARRPRWEFERLAHMFERVTEGITVFDVGAEVGDFTCLYREWAGPGGQCIPFEASAPYWPAIRQTWEANGHEPPRFTYSGFVSDVTKDGPSEGIVSGWPDASVGEIQPDFGFAHLAQQATQRDQTTLTDFALETGVVPDVVVLDIEGSEYPVCEGAKDLFVEARPLLYISVHYDTMRAWYGKTIDDLDALLVSLGYSASLIHDPGNEAFWFYE